MISEGKEVLRVGRVEGDRKALRGSNPKSMAVGLEIDVARLDFLRAFCKSWHGFGSWSVRCFVDPCTLKRDMWRIRQAAAIAQGFHRAKSIPTYLRSNITK